MRRHGERLPSTPCSPISFCSCSTAWPKRPQHLTSGLTYYLLHKRNKPLHIVIEATVRFRVRSRIPDRIRIKVLVQNATMTTSAANVDLDMTAGSIGGISGHEETVAQGDRMSVSRHAMTPRSSFSKGYYCQNSATNLPCLSGLVPMSIHFWASRCLHLGVPCMFQACTLGISCSAVRFCVISSR